MLKEYEDRKIPIFTEDRNSHALSRSIEKGYIDIVRILLGHQGVNLRIIGRPLHTALKSALTHDKKEISDLLATYHAISDIDFNEEEMGDYYRSKGEQEANVREYLTKLNLISRVFREEGLSIKQILNFEITAKDIKAAEENSQSTTATIDSFVGTDLLSLEAIKSDVRTEAEPRTEITKAAESLFRLKNNGIGIGFFNLVNSKLPDDKKIKNLREIDSAIEFLSKAKLIPTLPEAISSLTITNTSKDQLQLISLASIVANFITNPERYVEKDEPPLAIIEESKESASQPPIGEVEEDLPSLAAAEESKKSAAEPPIGKVAKLRTATKESRMPYSAKAARQPTQRPGWRAGPKDREQTYEELPGDPGSKILTRLIPTRPAGKPTRPATAKAVDNKRGGERNDSGRK